MWLVTETEVTNDINDAYTRMQGLGTVYAVTGNHESAPVNSFPPLAVSTDMSSQWVYNALSKNWAGWIGSAGASQASSNHGSYSYVDKSGLRIISVNTNFWYKQNFWLYERTMEHDPSGMFAWLVSELEVAEAAGQRAWIIGHMPMGTTDTFHDASYYFGEWPLTTYISSRSGVLTDRGNRPHRPAVRGHHRGRLLRVIRVFGP